MSGPESVGAATRSAGLGIGVASLMRMVLFLAALGIVHQGLALDPANPSASVFRYAAGELGFRFFGVVMWSASITSVIGSAYTSVSFVRTLRAGWARHTRAMIIGFIVLSTVVFLAVGRPVIVLVVVGALNGLILPVGLATMLVASRRPELTNGYRHPIGLTLAGWVVTLAMGGMGVWTVGRLVVNRGP